MLRAVIRADKYDGTGINWLRKNLERQPMGIIAVANDSQDCSVNKCHDKTFGCQDLCFTNEFGSPYCECRHGKLNADGKTCSGKLEFFLAIVRQSTVMIEKMVLFGSFYNAMFGSIGMEWTVL